MNTRGCGRGVGRIHGLGDEVHCARIVSAAGWKGASGQIMLGILLFWLACCEYMGCPGRRFLPNWDGPLKKESRYFFGHGVVQP